jgi:hypothetical protein
MKTFRTFFIFIIILFVAVQTVCGNSGNENAPAGISQVIVFSDVHFNPFYDATLFHSLVETDASRWESIFTSSSITEPSTWGEDSNYSLFALALSSIRANLASSSIAIFPGDILVHDFDTRFYTLYGTEDQEAMKAFLCKTVTFFATEVRANLGDIPVMFELGNNDSYEGDFKIEPNSQFLTDTAEPFFALFLNGTADHDTFLGTYKTGGYYSATPLGMNLLVIGLNSIFFSPKAASDTAAAATAELDWFEKALASASASGQKVWLITHIPAGANISSTKDLIDSEGHLSDAKMMWVEDYQTRFLSILSAYPDTVTMIFTGHTHMDEFRLPLGALEVTQGISPIDGNDPAYKIFTFTRDSFLIVDYDSLYCDLSNPAGQFDDYYNFSESYYMNKFLNVSLEELFPLLKTDPDQQELYRECYYSGHDSASPITDANWPVYWCGTEKMAKQDYIDCVNSYGN